MRNTLLFIAVLTACADHRGDLPGAGSHDEPTRFLVQAVLDVKDVGLVCPFATTDIHDSFAFVVAADAGQYTVTEIANTPTTIANVKFEPMLTGTIDTAPAVFDMTTGTVTHTDGAIIQLRVTGVSIPATCTVDVGGMPIVATGGTLPPELDLTIFDDLDGDASITGDSGTQFTFAVHRVMD